ncbi:hypothetical protein FB451DRAFT_1400776 [Mycena latifolia]|nr:hypothetical protein FB451DRAFT_1400776 [Mycena latifolia]
MPSNSLIRTRGARYLRPQRAICALQCPLDPFDFYGASPPREKPAQPPPRAATPPSTPVASPQPRMRAPKKTQWQKVDMVTNPITKEFSIVCIPETGLMSAPRTVPLYPPDRQSCPDSRFALLARGAAQRAVRPTSARFCAVSSLQRTGPRAAPQSGRAFLRLRARRSPARAVCYVLCTWVIRYRSAHPPFTVLPLRAAAYVPWGTALHHIASWDYQLKTEDPRGAERAQSWRAFPPQCTFPCFA